MFSAFTSIHEFDVQTMGELKKIDLIVHHRPGIEKIMNRLFSLCMCARTGA